MKQAVTSATPAHPLPADFTDWLENEKSDARSHQLRILKAVLLIIFGVTLFLVKNQPEWIAGLLDFTGAPALK